MIFCYHGGKFFEWGRWSHSPVTPLMSREEFTAFCRREMGERFMRNDFDRLVARAETHGWSHGMESETLTNLISFNQAGPNEMRVPVPRLLAALVAGENPRSIPAEECIPFDDEND